MYWVKINRQVIVEYRFFYTKIYYVNLLCKLPRIYPYTDYSGASPVYKSNASSGNHYTNGVNEKTHVVGTPEQDVPLTRWMITNRIGQVVWQ